MKKKIIFIYGSRADYGIIKNLLKLSAKSKLIDLTLILTGSHLDKIYGYSYKEILQDKNKINYKIHNKVINNNEIDAINLISSSSKKLAKLFIKINPDLIFLTGDRYEMIAPAFTSLILKYPIAHLHGGEITLGSLDNAIRNSITMMSKYHFVASLNAKKRILDMGISKRNIYHVGSPSIDVNFQTKLLSKNNISKDLDIMFEKHNILLTFHSETNIKNQNIESNIKILIDSLLILKNTNIYIAGINADPHSFKILKSINSFKDKSKNIFYFKNLGKTRYLSLAKYCDFVIGNSSSGLIEIPTLNIPTINIGDRQKGRDHGNSVINIAMNRKSIRDSINKIYSGYFKKIKFSNPYYKPNSNKNIIKILENLNF